MPINGYPKSNNIKGTLDQLKPPSNFIAGRPKAVLQFWFFGDPRYCLSLFTVILVLYKYINR